MSYGKHSCRKMSLGNRAARKLRPKTGLIFLVLVLWSSATPTQVVAFLITPPRIRLTGALFSIEGEKQKGVLHELNVFVREKQWTLRLAKAEFVPGTGRNRMILQRLFPLSVRFVGPEDLIHPLLRPEIAGKPLIIEGLLYTGTRTLFITAVEEAEKAHTH